jgi:hypothetical protein
MHTKNQVCFMSESALNVCVGGDGVESEFSD